MRGSSPTLPDINLELQELVLPVNLVSDESLSPDDNLEEEQRQTYSVESCCDTCHACIKLVVTATDFGIIRLQQLLVSQLAIICPRCSRGRYQHGGS
uniref:Protein E7 n=1 Tax=Human papillomavirus TaxID=10566 RepID=A0A385PI03_9PAPI|nr:MAG: E7 protein [Human papillomavirus]